MSIQQARGLELMDFPYGPSEKDRLRVLHASGLLDGQRIPALDEICLEAQQHFDVATAIVTLIDVDRQIFKAKQGIAAHGTPRSMAFCNYTILSDKVFVVPDAKKDPIFENNPLVTGPPFVRFYAGAPLVFERDTRLGALCLLNPEPREFSPGDRAELQEMADRVVSIIARFWFNIP